MRKSLEHLQKSEPKDAEDGHFASSVHVECVDDWEGEEEDDDIEEEIKGCVRHEEGLLVDEDFEGLSGDIPLRTYWPLGEENSL